MRRFKKMNRKPRRSRRATGRRALAGVSRRRRGGRRVLSSLRRRSMVKASDMDVDEALEEIVEEARNEITSDDVLHEISDSTMRNIFEIDEHLFDVYVTEEIAYAFEDRIKDLLDDYRDELEDADPKEMKALIEKFAEDLKDSVASMTASSIEEFPEYLFKSFVNDLFGEDDICREENLFEDDVDDLARHTNIDKIERRLATENKIDEEGLLEAIYMELSVGEDILKELHPKTAKIVSALVSRTDLNVLVSDIEESVLDYLKYDSDTQNFIDYFNEASKKEKKQVIREYNLIEDIVYRFYSDYFHGVTYLIQKELDCH